MVEIKCKHRSIIRHGYSRYVALPPSWMLTHNLKAGDLLLPIIQEDGALRIDPPKEETDDRAIA